MTIHNHTLQTQSITTLCQSLHNSAEEVLQRDRIISELQDSHLAMTLKHDTLHSKHLELDHKHGSLLRAYKALEQHTDALTRDHEALDQTHNDLERRHEDLQGKHETTMLYLEDEKVGGEKRRGRKMMIE